MELLMAKFACILGQIFDLATQFESLPKLGIEIHSYTRTSTQIKGLLPQFRNSWSSPMKDEIDRLLAPFCKKSIPVSKASFQHALVCSIALKGDHIWHITPFSQYLPTWLPGMLSHFVKLHSPVFPHASLDACLHIKGFEAVLDTIKTLHWLKEHNGSAPNVFIELPFCDDINFDVWKEEFGSEQKPKIYLRNSKQK
jgi:hypothetical protein